MIRAAILFLVQAVMASIAYGHGGGFDRYGCHNDRKAKNYHCHEGIFANEAFLNQGEMLAKLRALETQSQGNEAKKKDIDERLKELKSLREQDLITAEEYDEKKAEVLDEL